MTLSVFPIASMAASFAGRSLVLALAVSPQVSAPPPSAATPKEQALMEHACRSAQRPGAANDVYEECLATRLQSLRADFGTDLGKLSVSARARIDAACNPAQASLGREAYVECLSAQLASQSGRARANRPAAVALPPQGAVMPSAALIIPPAPQEASLVSRVPVLSVQSAGIALGTLGLLAGLVVVGMKSKRVQRKCRVCGAVLPGTGDLCASCRHEAAEPLRRAAGERAERQRAEEAEQRQRELADEQRQETLRQEEAERVRRVEEERQLEEVERRRDEDVRQDDTEVPPVYAVEPPTPAAVWSSDEDGAAFDPYRGLGLGPDASLDEVRAAYEAARLKYDPDLVEHLGSDVKDHFAEKFKTAERAYRMLTEHAPIG